MQIEEAIQNISLMPEGNVLVAKPPFTWGSEAMFVALTEDFRVPQAVQEAGFQYLVGRDDILNLRTFMETKNVSTRTSAEFIIHYATTDSAPAWIEDIPNRG